MILNHRLDYKWMLQAVCRMTDIPPKIKTRMNKELDRAVKGFLKSISGHDSFHAVGFIEDDKAVVHYYRVDEPDEDGLETLRETAIEYDINGKLMGVIGAGEIIEVNDETQEIEESFEGIILTMTDSRVMYSMFQVIENGVAGKKIEFEAELVKSDFDEFII